MAFFFSLSLIHKVKFKFLYCISLFFLLEPWAAILGETYCFWTLRDKDGRQGPFFTEANLLHTTNCQ